MSSNSLKRFPAIISYSTQNILEKNKFFNNYLNLSQTDFNRIIKLLPSFYSYKNESILEKINFYSTTFELTKEDVIKIIKVFKHFLKANLAIDVFLTPLVAISSITFFFLIS